MSESRYLLRAPVSLERLWYNPEAGTVTIHPLTYANASVLRRMHQQVLEEQEVAAPWMAPAEEPTPFERRCGIRWAQLIRRVGLEDPLLCPDCGGEMHVNSFITDPPVVYRILRHLRWRSGDALLPGFPEVGVCRN